MREKGNSATCHQEDQRITHFDSELKVLLKVFNREKAKNATPKNDQPKQTAKLELQKGVNAYKSQQRVFNSMMKRNAEDTSVKDVSTARHVPKTIRNALPSQRHMSQGNLLPSKRSIRREPALGSRHQDSIIGGESGRVPAASTSSLLHPLYSSRFVPDRQSMPDFFVTHADVSGPRNSQENEPADATNAHNQSTLTAPKAAANFVNRSRSEVLFLDLRSLMPEPTSSLQNSYR